MILIVSHSLYCADLKALLGPIAGGTVLMLLAQASYLCRFIADISRQISGFSATVRAAENTLLKRHARKTAWESYEYELKAHFMILTGLFYAKTNKEIW